MSHSIVFPSIFFSPIKVQIGTTKSSEMNLDDDISFGLQLGSRDLFDGNLVGMFEQDGIHGFW